MKNSRARDAKRRRKERKSAEQKAFRERSARLRNPETFLKQFRALFGERSREVIQLAKAGRTPDEIAGELQLDRRKVKELIDALVSMPSRVTELLLDNDFLCETATADLVTKTADTLIDKLRGRRGMTMSEVLSHVRQELRGN